MASGDASRHIPELIKRTVRQRCRFGCVMCGAPVYHYEHIDDFAVVQEHTAENITLLCPNHHQEKTSARLPRDIIRRFDENPHNARREFTTEHSLFFSADEVVFSIGSNNFSSPMPEGNRFTAIEFNKQEFAAFRREEDMLLLNLVVNDAVLNPILLVEDGELKISTGVQDVTMIGPNLVLRPSFSIKPIKIGFSVRGVNISSGFFYGWGRTLEVSPDKILINPGAFIMRNCDMWGCRTGISA